ncbi:hypothetical protein [Sedimentitalea todarodis]|uniref:Uncharacterized protein n=1 Tax=Sedimentitalea todarodis TaxID=1631240 RepID=A0ABU3VHY3_9RHOB|nr:hypothetical protein [Sedimentitalea todarodis]MDU9005786.1 hypothetical protein [Sedimentitalea todarodis]
MQSKRLLSLVFAVTCLGGPGGAADFSDPTWPCIQRKVERLSVGLMWPHPIEDVTLSDQEQAAVNELVGRFTLRRLALDEIAPVLGDFTAKYGAESQLLGTVFAKTFDRLAATRTTILKGIEEYSLSQIAMAEKIGATRGEMDRLLAAEPPDYDKVDAIEAQLDWDERIYTDRKQSLTYVCETPILLEKRLFAIAQMLLNAAEN